MAWYDDSGDNDNDDEMGTKTRTTPWKSLIKYMHK